MPSITSSASTTRKSSPRYGKTGMSVPWNG
nr:MAG TPA: hypothetical protein [Caudoviricetes sp.]